jgi:hypothetical protein
VRATFFSIGHFAREQPAPCCARSRRPVMRSGTTPTRTSRFRSTAARPSATSSAWLRRRSRTRASRWRRYKASA